MSKYKCPARGDCDVADAGTVLELTDGKDPICDKCGAVLSPLASAAAAATGSSRKTPLIAGVVVALVLAVGGAGLLMRKPTLVSIEVAAPSKVAHTISASASASASAAAVVVTQPAHPGIAPSDAETRESRLKGDAKLAQGDVNAAEAASNKAAASELLKLAIAKMSRGKLDDAEKDLNDARARDPEQPLVYYNMAILRLKQGRNADANKEFEASFMAGFSYFDKMDGDTDLNALRKDPQFVALVAHYRPAAK